MKITNAPIERIYNINKITEDNKKSHSLANTIAKYVQIAIFITFTAYSIADIYNKSLSLNIILAEPGQQESLIKGALIGAGISIFDIGVKHLANIPYEDPIRNIAKQALTTSVLYYYKSHMPFFQPVYDLTDIVKKFFLS
jgi:hypothetical protein